MVADAPVSLDSGKDASTFNPTCGASSVSSSCANPLSIVRVVAKLGPQIAQATGKLVVKLTHYRLGGGSTAGVAHTETSKFGLIGPSTTEEVHFDMCADGAMWVEDTCEFNLWAFLDTNNNGVLDTGEPAGRTVLPMSCRATEAPCVGLVLDCTTGMSCATFADPANCTCGTACNSIAKTCK